MEESQVQEGIQAFKSGNYEEALQLLLPKAEERCINAQYYVGRIYHNEEGRAQLPQNFAEAMRWYTEAALANHIDAQFYLARLYDDMELSEENAVLSRKWYLKAARGYRHRAMKGEMHAQFRLGEMYLYGWGVQSNPHRALKWLYEAVEHENSCHKYTLATYLSLGVGGIPVDLQQAKTLLLDAAEEGDVDAQFRVGINFQEGWEEFPANQIEAVRWFQIAATHGHAGAKHSLAMKFLTGDGVPINEDKGRSLLVAAAEAGEICALSGLIQFYEEGLYGFPKDSTTARFWRKKAIDNQLKFW